MRNFLPSIFLLFLFACEEKEDTTPSLSPLGDYYSVSIIEDSPIRCFTKDGEILDITEVNNYLASYNEVYSSIFQEDTSNAFTDVKFYNDTISIFPTHAYFADTKQKYDYTIKDNLLSCESQEFITFLLTISDYQKRLLSSSTIYPIPDFIEIPTPAASGINYTTHYIDKKYVHIVDNNTLRVPFARYIHGIYYSPQNYSGFGVLPVQLNNSLNDKGYGEIAENGVLLVKEYEVEYKRR